MLTPEQEKGLREAERVTYENTWNINNEERLKANGESPEEIARLRQAAMDKFEADFDSRMGGIKTNDAMRAEAMRYMNGEADLNLGNLQTQYTAGIPRQYSAQASAQAAQMANNGLSGSGLARRAQRNNRLDENQAWNTGMAKAQGDYQDNQIANRERALQMLQGIGDLEGQGLAMDALRRANRRNESATDKSGGAQQAYEFIGGIRNGLSGENGVF